MFLEVSLPQKAYLKRSMLIELASLEALIDVISLKFIGPTQNWVLKLFLPILPMEKAGLNDPLIHFKIALFQNYDSIISRI